MDRFATFLSGELGRPVNNETGLEVLYSFKLEWEPDLESENPDSPAGASLVTALKEQSGLRLAPKRGPVQVYVIEKITRLSDN